jgi:glycosyltransferase involved in cell wall biosynthesis
MTLMKYSTSNHGRVGVMHLTDTLDAGGLERVAVNLVNTLPRARYHAHLCTTRRDGALAELVAPGVGRLCLNRRRSIDAGAVVRLAAYIKEHQIKLLHAHGTALFIARAAATLTRGVNVVWHDHYGRYLEQERPALLYKLATRGVGGVIAVNEPLAAWSRERLGVPAERVRYVPNFVCEPPLDQATPELPGAAGGRVVCVANLRPQKDHLNLVRAMQAVKREAPHAHLILVGGGHDEAHRAKIFSEVESRGLSADVSWLGERRDVSAILGACDVGVLGSASEGLPLALIEYGMAGLPVVATDVGQCAEVLDNGRAGLLVPPGRPGELAAALLSLLNDGGRAAQLGARLRARVRSAYSAEAVIEQVCRVYEMALGGERRVAALAAGRAGAVS